MKTILIATDFSAAANNATTYGMELAKSFNARVILLTCCKPVMAPAIEVPTIEIQAELQAVMYEQLLNESHNLSARYTNEIVSCSKTGMPALAIQEATREYQADLVITGMKTHGKMMRRVVGSTVTELLRILRVPMIIVPEEATYHYIVDIALATDSDLAPEADPHVLDALREIGEKFHSKLYLVRVVSNHVEAAYEVKNRPPQLTKITRSMHPSYECIENKDLPAALKNFARVYDIDLLAMLPHKHSLFERLFIKSATRTMAFETPIPLLVLPGLHTKGRPN